MFWWMSLQTGLYLLLLANVPHTIHCFPSNCTQALISISDPGELGEWPWWDVSENWWTTMVRSRWRKCHPNHYLGTICACLLSIYPRPLWHFIVTLASSQVSRSVWSQYASSNTHFGGGGEIYGKILIVCWASEISEPFVFTWIHGIV